MSDNPSGRVAGLFAAMLGVSAAVGLSLFWLGRQPAAAPAEEAVAAEPVKTEAAKSAVPAPEPRKVARAPKRRTKITWEGGGSDSSPSEQAAAPARPYYTGGAVNQPRPVRIFQPRVEVTRANGKIIVTTYRPGR